MPPNNNEDEYDPYRDPESPFYDPYADPDSPMYDPYLDPDAPWEDPDWKEPEPEPEPEPEEEGCEDIKQDCETHEFQPGYCLECCFLFDCHGNFKRINCEPTDCPGSSLYA